VTPIRWSSQAADDLEAIRSFIGRDSPYYARLVVQRIAAAIDQLATFPQMGRVVKEIGDPSVREVIVGAYRVVYRYRHDAVEIATIFHSARLFPANDG
jgi:plasmid stabilization system protein ParE